MRRLLLAALFACAPLAARAQGGAALTIVAPAAPGGGWDQLARTMQRTLELEGIARSVQVENVPGAAGTIGLARFVSGRVGDPRALLVTGLVMVGGIAQNASPVRLDAATPIARLVGEYEAVAVPAASPLKSLGDLLDLLQRDIGAVSWGGGSAGGTDQMLVDLVAQSRALDPRRTSYVAFAGGGEARAALLGGQVTVGVSGVGEFAELATSGLVRILAVSAPERLPGIDAPTLREAGVDVVLANWRGVMAPPGLRAADRRRLEEEILRMTTTRTWKDELARRGWQDLTMGSDAFGRYLVAEVNRVERLAQARRGAGAPVGTRGPRLPAVLVTVLLIALVAGRRGVEASGGAPRHWRPVALILSAMLVNLLVSERAGFVPGAALLFGSTAFAFGERRWTRLVPIACGFALGTFLLFRGLLGVALPVGTWWSGGAG
jgi:putative tricarboxylic transport membrane protein